MAADSNGTCDPYIRFLVDGATKESSHKNMTTDPNYYETLQFTMMLPKNRDLFPQIVLQAWDSDVWSPDDLIGSAHLYVFPAAYKYLQPFPKPTNAHRA